MHIDVVGILSSSFLASTFISFDYALTMKMKYRGTILAWAKLNS